MIIITEVTSWLEDPAVRVGKHGVVDHHAFVCFLPVQCHHLNASSPVKAGIGIAAIHPKTFGVYPHKEVPVVSDHCSELGSVRSQVQEVGLAQAEDVTGGP